MRRDHLVMQINMHVPAKTMSVKKFTFSKAHTDLVQWVLNHLNSDYPNT